MFSSRTIVVALIFGATMDTLDPRPLSPAERFHALFDDAPSAAFSEPGMPRARKPDAHQKELLRPYERRQAVGIRPHDMAWLNYVDVYLGHVRLRSKSVYAVNVERVLNRFTEYRGLFGTKLNAITTVDLEGYATDRQRDSSRNGGTLSARTLNNEIDILNAAFAYAGPKDRTRGGRKHLGWITDVPFCDRVPEDDVDPVELTDEQIQAFIKATKSARTPRLEGCTPADFWLCALILDSLTLLRRRALLLIKRPADEILLVKKQLFLPASINKTKRDEYISIGTSDVVPQLLAKLPSKPGEPLLPWVNRQGQPMSLDHFTDTIRDMQRRAGIPEDQRIRLKDLRSTSANRVEDAFDEATAKSKLKHGPNTNTYRKNYRKRKPKPKEIAATDSLANWLFGVLKKADEPPEPGLRVIG